MLLHEKSLQFQSLGDGDRSEIIRNVNSVLMIFITFVYNGWLVTDVLYPDFVIIPAGFHD